MVDVTRKDLYLDFPLMTKAGTPWRCKGGYRVKWEDIEKSDTIIKTNFGEFFFKERIKVDKVWYWTLSDGKYEYTIKRDQARKNKKMPKNATIKNIVKVTKTTAKPKEMLLLPEPKEPVDYFLEEVIYLVKEHNRKNVAKNGKPKKRGMIALYNKTQKKDKIDQFRAKVIYIIARYQELGRGKEGYIKLINAYHPDKSKKDTSEEFRNIKSLEKIFL